MWLYVISFLFFPYIGYAFSKTCNAKFCDPNWTPYDNMVAALRGYNIRSGNPIQNNGDPGFMGQIFLPTKINDFGRIELEAGITASELSFCQRSLTSRAFTTMNGYRKYVAESSSSGMNLQVGTDTEVTAGVNLKGVNLSAKKVIPKPFERAWGDSRDFKKLTEFFSEKHGLVSITMGTCTIYEMKLDQFHLPPFTIPFQIALKKLFDYKDYPVYLKKATFRRFIQEYGTHFLIRTKMGAQYVYRTKFSENARENFNAETLKSCSYVKGSKIFGIQIEKDQSRCTASDIQKMNRLRTSDIQASIITKGSRPTDIKNWATQKFTPVPLKFELSPIVNLFTEHYISKANLKTSKGEKITSLEIRKWFLPLYFDYCRSMNVDCGHKKGCGFDDKCPVDAICVPGGSKHECSAWGQWTCIVNCGQGTRQRRTRQCTGCKGSIEQVAVKRCAKQKDCYNYPNWPSEFRWSSAGRVPGMHCVQILETADPHTWADNFLCWRKTGKNPGIKWSSAGRISGMRCTRIIELADPHTWHDNFLCVPPNSPYHFMWSMAGPLSGLHCIRWHEPADPHTWGDNYLCASRVGSHIFREYPYWPIDFRWSSAGRVPGMHCVQILETADPHTWADNFFCWRKTGKNPGIKWSSAGRISGMRCTQIVEIADPHSWHDNFLCVPPNSPYHFMWSSAGPLPGLHCIRWHESADPHTWGDNYLCASSVVK